MHDIDLGLKTKALEIDISSPIFLTMLNDLNMEIKRVLEKVYDESFSQGEISLKLKLTINDDYKEYPVENIFTGEINTESYRYRRPYFEHQVASTLKKQYKQEGFYTEEKEVICDDGRYLVIPLREPQISMFEEE